MIMHKKSDGSYEQIGFIKSKDGENIDKIVDKNGGIYFEQGFTKKASGVPPLMLNTIGKPLKNYAISGNTVQDGTPSPDNSVKVKSVGDLVTEGENQGKYCIPVATAGKNLFDYVNTSYIDGAYLDTNGDVVQHKSWQYTDYIKVNGTEFTISGIYGVAPCICFYDKYKNLIASINYDNRKYFTINLNAKAYFCRFSIHNTQYMNKNKIQLELGSEATPYEPYHEPIITPIYLDEPLMQNEAINSNGERTIKWKKIKIKDLNWEYDPPTRRIASQIILDMEINSVRTISMYCKLYRNLHNSEDFDLVRDMNYIIYNTIDPRIYIHDFRYTNVNDFVSENGDVDILYPLSNELTKSINTPQLLTFKPTISITTDTEIQPSNIKITYKARK